MWKVNTYIYQEYYKRTATLFCIMFVALDNLQFLLQKKISIDEKSGT